ncbi:MAG TPA: Crp/Fnr family transcriptional regulator [Anaerolineales bacterium]|nr:Crp/Fnr family transcriptional regulator [Anaerolineales bacterium]
MSVRKYSPLKAISIDTHQCSISLRLEILSQVPFFRGLGESDLEWINFLFHEKGFETDEFICQSGESAEHLFIVADGKVRQLNYTLSGKNILLDLLTQGEFFGAVSGLGDEVYPETAQAHTNCCVLVIDRDSFQKILKRYPTVALSLIEIMANRLRAANERVKQLSALTVEARIAITLLMLLKKLGSRKGKEVLLQVPLTREDLAGMVGATPESTSRVMSRFQKDGLIRSGRGWVSIIDKPGLENLAGEEI